MQRRAFVQRLVTVSASAFVAPLALRAQDGECESGEGIQTFGYYEGILPNDTRSPNRTDGSAYNMPCISAADIATGEEKTYDFWHGHGQTHRFTVTAENFTSLQEGTAVEVYTTVVDGHRHALRISPAEPCD